MEGRGREWGKTEQRRERGRKEGRRKDEGISEGGRRRKCEMA